MKKTLIFAIFLICITGIIAQSNETAVNMTLDRYPFPFIDGGKLNTKLVIGSLAQPIDNIAVTGIGMSLQNSLERGQRVPINAVVFDREITNISAQNLIVVGGPCVNTVAAELMGNMPDCTQGFRDGIGNIKLIQTNTNTYALIVAGKWGEDTRRAGLVLANFFNYKLKGTEINVESEDSSKIETH